MPYITITGKLLDERDDAIYIAVDPRGNWLVWLPRSTINPKGGLRIKRGTGDVSADVAGWKVEELVRKNELPESLLHSSTTLANIMREHEDGPEATDERFTRKGQYKT